MGTAWLYTTVQQREKIIILLRVVLFLFSTSTTNLE